MCTEAYGAAVEDIGQNVDETIQVMLASWRGVLCGQRALMKCSNVSPLTAFRSEWVFLLCVSLSAQDDVPASQALRVHLSSHAVHQFHGTATVSSFVYFLSM